MSTTNPQSAVLVELEPVATVETATPTWVTETK